MQLKFNDTIYKKAISELYSYWEGHTCNWDDCTIDEDYLAKEYENPNPTVSDLQTALENLASEADMRGIAEDEVCDEYDDEGRGEVNLLIYGLEKELEIA